MGWNTFITEINENLINETVDVIVEFGLRDAGYAYLILEEV